MMAEGIIKETKLANMVEHFCILAEKAVNQWRKWKHPMFRHQPIKMLLSNTFTLTSIRNNTAKISGNLKLNQCRRMNLQRKAPLKCQQKQKALQPRFDSLLSSTGVLISKGSTKSHIEGNDDYENQARDENAFCIEYNQKL